MKIVAGGQVVVGNPPNPMMEDACMATPFGVVMAGKETARSRPSLGEHEVKLAFSLGEWVAQVAKVRALALQGFRVQRASHAKRVR